MVRPKPNSAAKPNSGVGGRAHLPKKVESKPSKVTIHKLPTGAPGLDDILGGGVPKLSFNIIAGTPGSGKTTLAHQIAFTNATPQRPAVYFTVLGEPTLKMLRYQQQYSFFDASKLGKAVHFISLSDAGAGRGLGRGVAGNHQNRPRRPTASGIVVMDSPSRFPGAPGGGNGAPSVRLPARTVSGELGSNGISGG